jgi:hypothetical protein
MQLIPSAIFQTGAGVPSFTTVTLSASGERIAYIFRAPKSGTLNKFEVYLKTVTNNPDNGLRFSFQNVDSSGDPDGTQDEYRDITSTLTAGWLAPGLITTTGADGGTKRTVVAGDLIACVIEFISFVASDSISFGVLDDYSNTHGVNNLHYISQRSGAGVWTKADEGAAFALTYSDSTYGIIPWWVPAIAFNTHTLSTSTTPDEAGLYFEVPMACTINGAWVRMDLDGAATIKLYQESTLLKSVTLDPDQRVSTAGHPLLALFGEVSLQANTAYRLTVLPTTTTSLAIYSFDVNSAGLMASFDVVTTFYMTQRTDAGAWTETTTRRPYMGPVFTGI